MTLPLKILSVFAVVFGLVGGCVVYALNTCEVPTRYATEMMVEELKQRGFDAKYLSAPSVSECEVSYAYISPTEDISYVVIDDPMHGLELHQYDNRQDTKQATR